VICWEVCAVEEPVRAGDIIESRKPHPCGSSVWTVLRIGADVRLRCEGCGRIVVLDASAFLRRRKKTVSRALPEASGESCQ